MPSALVSSGADEALFGRDSLAKIQRARIVAAMVQVACERGAASVSVAHVVERAGVSRRTFYELFGDRDECFLAAFEQALAGIESRVVPAFGRGVRWAERVRGALVELLAFCELEPQLARIVLVESAAGGSAVLERRVELLGRVTAIVEQGRTEAPRGDRDGASESDPTSLAAEGVVGGVHAVLSARLAGAAAHSGSAQVDFLCLAGPLMSMIVLPYLGAAAARREASRAVPARVKVAAAQDAETVEFHGLGIRLTYRTLRVLTAVAKRSGESNRAIGESAGVSDQGQTSKLLSRLQRVGLIENASAAAAAKGAPNSWALTPKGAQILEGLRIPADANRCEEIGA